MDVTARAKEIERWERMSAIGKAEGPRPDSLQEGETFEKTYQLPSKAIFWTKGIKLDSDGTRYGSGTLSLELVLLDTLGFNLQQNPYALNETIRILIRTITPFLILILVSRLTQPDDRRRLDRFFVKMKTLVRIDPQEDAKELELSYADPNRFDHKKLFPHSNWEFDKWTRTDLVGFIVSALVAVGVVLFLLLLLSIGK